MMPNPSRPLRPLAFAALAALVAFAPVPLAAQQSTTRGFNLGFHVQGASLTVENGEANSGGGLGIRFGYGVNRIVNVYLEVDGSAVDVQDDTSLSGEWNMAHVDLGARFHFANSLRRWVPYLEAAIGARAVGVTEPVVNNQQVEDVSFNGSAFSIGGGIDVYLNESLALDLGLKVSSGEFTQIDVGAVSVSGLDVDATSTRFKVGIVWWK